VISSDEAKSEMQDSKLEKRKAKIARWAETQRARFSNLAFRFSDLLGCLPWRLLSVAACLLLLVIWLREHDARLRREVEFGQLKQQTAAQVTELRARADAALRAANEENARAIESLEARRRRLEREAEELRQRLGFLREEERARVRQVATLPTSELEKRVAARLAGQVAGVGGQVSDKRDSGLGTRDSGRQEQVSGVGSQVSGKELSGDQTRSPSEKDATPDTRYPAPDTSLVPNPESRVRNPDFVFTEEGARRIETAFLELDSCRAQSAVKDGALSNCQEQVATQAAIAGELRQSLAELNQAIRLKDEIASRTETLHRAELKAARGTRASRFLRAVEYVGLGVVIGLVAR
jgi:hypothetical protein